MADSLRVDIRERAEELVDIKLDFQNRHRGLHLVKVPRSTVNRFWNKLEYQVQVQFILLNEEHAVSRQSAYINNGYGYSNLPFLRWSSKRPLTQRYWDV